MTNNLSYLLTLLSLLGLLSSSLAQDQPSPDGPKDNHGYSPSMATLFIVIIGVLFTVAFVSVYLKHFAWCFGLDLGSGRGRGGGGGAWRREPARGLDPLLIESFPTFLYSDVKQHRVGKGSLECAVCLSEFSDDEILRILPGCSHVFHPHCIRPWLASHVSCPLCRKNLEFLDPGPPNDTLAQHLQRPLSDDQSEPSDQNHNQNQSPQHPPHVHDMTIKSPLQQIKHGLDRIIKLPRSHSTGHSFVEDCERFTLRLPEDVRNKLANANLSPLLLPAMISPRVTYRTRSIGMGDKPDRWRFSVSPPFIHRPGSALSPRFDGVVDHGSNNVNSTGLMIGPRSLLKSMKSPLNRMVRSSDIGERSSDRLWSDRPVQDLELESQK